MDYNKACIILGVTESDTVETIRKKYLKLIAKYHPDINQSSDATKKAQEINQAYDYLKEHYENRSTENETKTYSSTSYYQSSYQTYAQNSNYQQQQYGGYDSEYSKYYEEFKKYYDRYWGHKQCDGTYNGFCLQYQDNEIVKEYMMVFNVDLEKVYLIYTKVKTDEEFIECLKNEIEIDKYCKILKKKRDSLMRDYIVEGLIKNILFLDYLKERVEELQYLNILGKRRKKLYSDYISWYGYVSEITFYEYIKGLVIIETKCKILKKSEKKLGLDYTLRDIEEQKYTFLEYLDIRIEEEKYCEILNESRNNLKYEYRTSGNYNITFIEFLKQKVERANKTDEENTDKKIMNNIDKILKTNSINSVSNQKLYEILFVVFKYRLEELFEILQDLNNKEELILVSLRIYKETHDSECIRYASILGRDIEELVKEYISIKPNLNFKEYLIFKIVNEKRDYNFEEEIKSRAKTKRK